MALLSQGGDGNIQLQKAKEDSRMADWRTWKKGRKTTWHWNEFDGSGKAGKESSQRFMKTTRLWKQTACTFGSTMTRQRCSAKKTGRETSPDKHINPPDQGADDRVL
jgi:hypothetical protein